MFQQPNLQGSLMATGLAIALYLPTTDLWLKQRWMMITLVFLVVLMSVGQILAAGSRVSLLGGLAAVLCIGAGGGAILWRRRGTLLLLLVALILGGLLGGWLNKQTQGLVFALDKFDNVGAVSDNRFNIYEMSVDVFKRSPLIGHGIGSFQREFQNQKVEYMAEGGPNVGEQRFSHPHNEFLFWMVETGGVGLLGLLAAATGVFAVLWRAGLPRGLMLSALLVPITLHTLVELPFYISTFHWLVLLVLLWFVFSSVPMERRPVVLSRSMAVLIFVISLPAVSGSAVFLTHSQVAQVGIMQYFKSRGQRVDGLSTAMNNLYFN
jgi:O-antigen polymerase